MSFRFAVLTVLGALVAGSAPASALSTNFGSAVGSSNDFSLPSGDNTLTFSSPSGAGTFTVGTTTGLFTFATGLGDFNSFSGDVLKVSFATPVTGALTIRFGIEDAFGTFGPDTLSVTSNTGVSASFSTTLDNLTLAEPEGTGTFLAPGLTSLTITSANPFAIASIATVPEPASLLVLATGMLALSTVRRRR